MRASGPWLSDHGAKPGVEPHPFQDPGSDHRSFDKLRRRLSIPSWSLRELSVQFTDERRYFVSEATVYRLPKAHDLITS